MIVLLVNKFASWIFCQLTYLPVNHFARKPFCQLTICQLTICLLIFFQLKVWESTLCQLRVCQSTLCHVKSLPVNTLPVKSLPVDNFRSKLNLLVHTFLLRVRDLKTSARAIRNSINPTFTPNLWPNSNDSLCYVSDSCNFIRILKLLLLN